MIPTTPLVVGAKVTLKFELHNAGTKCATLRI
jgi:hypothetical protein